MHSLAATWRHNVTGEETGHAGLLAYDVEFLFFIAFSNIYSFTLCDSGVQKNKEFFYLLSLVALLPSGLSTLDDLILLNPF